MIWFITGCNFKLVISNSHIEDEYHEPFLWNRPKVNATRPYWWWLNIGSGNGLVHDGTITWSGSMAPDNHDDVIIWKHFPCYWPFVRGIHRSPVNSPHKGQWLGALMFCLICAWINSWVNNGEAGDLRRNHTHYDVNAIKHWSCMFCGIYSGFLQNVWE